MFLCAAPRLSPCAIDPRRSLKRWHRRSRRYNGLPEEAWWQCIACEEHHRVDQAQGRPLAATQLVSVPSRWVADFALSATRAFRQLLMPPCFLFRRARAHQPQGAGSFRYYPESPRCASKSTTRNFSRTPTEKAAFCRRPSPWPVTGLLKCLPLVEPPGQLRVGLRSLCRAPAARIYLPPDGRVYADSALWSLALSIHISNSYAVHGLLWNEELSRAIRLQPSNFGSWEPYKTPDFSRLKVTGLHQDSGNAAFP